MMSLVLLLILSFDFNEAMSRKGYLKGDMKNNENKYINIQKYILNILKKLTDAQKQLFLQRLWYILHYGRKNNIYILHQHKSDLQSSRLKKTVRHAVS